jgi:hypothetical protein
MASSAEGNEDRDHRQVGGMGVAVVSLLVVLMETGRLRQYGGGA